MTIDQLLPDDEPPDPIDETAIRKQAVFRSYLCPGAGFALTGQRSWAIATFAATLLLPLPTAWLAFRPGPAAFWTTSALLGATVVLWIAEQFVIKKAQLREPGPTLLVKHFVFGIQLSLAAGIAMAGLLFWAFGSNVMAGSGMRPTLEAGERVLHYKFPDRQSVKPGSMILFRNSPESDWGEPKWHIIARVLAVPGDTLAIEDGKYLVNGKEGPAVSPTGNHRVVLEVPAAPESLTVPEGCYFVSQDTPADSLDSRVLSWAHADDIVATRFWYLSRRGMLKPVE